MMSSSDTGTDSSPVQNISAQYSKMQRQYQQVLDRLTPHMLYRWLGTAGLLAVFMLRIVLAQGVSVASFFCPILLGIHFHSPILFRCLNLSFTLFSISSGISVSTLNISYLLSIHPSAPSSPAVCCKFHRRTFLSIRLTPDLDAHAIYLLNLLLAFLQPKFDPSLQDDLMADEIEEGGDTPSPLPSQRDDEFRPFVRRLPEWQFW